MLDKIPPRPCQAIFGALNHTFHPFRHWTGRVAGGRIMKVRASVRRMCDKCKLIKRKGVVRVICEDPRHKQRQG